jgi:hypothetical protein
MPLPTNPIVRLLAEGIQGTGLLISDVDILTARHVTAAGKNLRASGQPWTGVRDIAATSFAADPYTDLALAHLSPAIQPLAAGCCSLVPSCAGAIQVGDEITVAGYSTRDLDLEERSFELTAYDGAANVLVLDRPAPEGFSGSPAFADGRLAGVVFARHLEQQCTFVHRLDEVIALVRASARGKINWDEQPPHWLRAFPLGPAVDGAQVFARAHLLIEAFVKLYDASRARMVIARANADRVNCGPATGERGTLDHNYFPRPEIDLFGFWQCAFVEAGLKSPRLLAALVSAPEDDLLTHEQRQARGALLNALKTWGQQGRA